LRDQALSFLIGQTSPAAYLDANLLNYRVTRFINEQLPRDARVLAIGDHRVYYAQREVIPDDSHDNWLRLAATAPLPADFAKQLRELGVTHLWVSEDDLIYFNRFCGVDSIMHGHAQFFVQFRDQYLEQVYTDAWGHSVYVLR
jgi:hypothetical protein